MAATHPQRVRIIVGGIYPLTFGVDSAKGSTVIFQEVSGSALARNFILHKGADLFVVIIVCQEKQRHTMSPNGNSWE